MQQVLDSIRSRIPVPDDDFDRIYDERTRCLSAVHWTPLEVAIKAAEMLVTSRQTRVLDVGSGAGKFCVVGALATEGRFIGVEQRQYLVVKSRRIAEELGITRAHFIHGNMADLDWSDFDAFYLYNPFYENIMDARRLDNGVEIGPPMYEHYVRTVERKLSLCRNGTRVVTYHGFGGCLLTDFDLDHREDRGGDHLDLWIKRPRFP